MSDPFLRQAVSALSENRFVEANKAIGHAIKLDPQNAQLHFLNGLTYHLRAQRGDSSQLDMAETGYQIALHFDPGLGMAAYQLGRLYLSRQQFPKAQDAFAQALLADPENLQFLLGLASSSYLVKDLNTAHWAAWKAEQIAPNSENAIQAMAMISAATGDMDIAEAYFGKLQSKLGPENPRLHMVSKRLGAWKNYYKRQQGFQLAQDTSDILGSPATQEGINPESNSSDSSYGGYSGSYGSSNSSSMANQPAKTAVNIPRMCLVDVVIIRSEERNSTDKGVNLLNGLTATFSGTIINWSSTKTNSLTSTTLSDAMTRGYSLTIPSTTYIINIFNDSNDRNEVLARPSLVALDGKQSEFFTGAVWHVELAGAAGGYGSVNDIPVGIRLKIKPQFLDDDTVQLEAEAARAYVETRASQANFNNFAQTTKTMVTANVALRFGQTLVLSGLSENETEELRDGVPGLQSIPGVQYLFSHQDTAEFRKSVLVLLTPREPRYTYQDGTDKFTPTSKEGKDDQPNLTEFQKTMRGFTPAPNLNATYMHISQAKLFREFRSGDVLLEEWDRQDSLMSTITRTLSFLYF